MLAVLIITMAAQEIGRHLSSSLLNPMQRSRKRWVCSTCSQSYTLHLENQNGAYGNFGGNGSVHYIDYGDVLTVYTCQILPNYLF